MSSPVFTNTDRTGNLNASGHDTGLYDPNRHDNQIVAVFETYERALAAKDELIKAGVNERGMRVLDQSQITGEAPDKHTIWSSLMSLFVPSEDAYGYAEGVRRGHAVLTVDPTSAADRMNVIHVLESADPIDFDAKLEEWRQAGYTYPYSGAVGAAAGMITPSPGIVPDDRPAVDAAEPTVPAQGRVGTRETPPGAVRVRSYVADRALEDE